MCYMLLLGLILPMSVLPRPYFKQQRSFADLCKSSGTDKCNRNPVMDENGQLLMDNHQYAAASLQCVFMSRGLPSKPRAEITKTMRNILSWTATPERIHFHIITEANAQRNISLAMLIPRIRITAGFSPAGITTYDGRTLHLQPSFNPRSNANWLSINLKEIGECTRFQGTLFLAGDHSNGAAVQFRTRGAQGIVHLARHVLRVRRRRVILDLRLPPGVRDELTIDVDDLGNPDFDWIRISGHFQCHGLDSDTKSLLEAASWPPNTKLHPIDTEWARNQEWWQTAGQWMDNQHVAGKKSETYVLKLFLHRLLPQLERVLVLDTDIYLMSDICQLADQTWDAFARSPDALFAYVHEQQDVYMRAFGLPGVNGGVGLMDLQRMRTSNYETWLSELSSKIGGECLPDYMAGGSDDRCNEQWNVIDQTVITLISRDHPDALISLPCEWNWQTAIVWYTPQFGPFPTPKTWVRPGWYVAHDPRETIRSCNRAPKLLHANYPADLKNAISAFIVESHRFALSHNQEVLRAALFEPQVRSLCLSATNHRNGTAFPQCDASAMVPLHGSRKLLPPGNQATGFATRNNLTRRTRRVARSPSDTAAERNSSHSPD